MKIELIISTQTLGDLNTDADNERYAAAVQAKLQTEYPEADVSVELDERATASSFWISDNPTAEIEENVRLIAAQIWDKERY